MAETTSNLSSAPKPRHIAIILDGNGRWAKKRNLPRVAGHRAGLEAVKRTIRACGDRGIEIITLFAFSSENWARPLAEVNYLMGLFLRSLQREIDKLHENNIQVRFIGDHSRFNPRLQEYILKAQQKTQQNTGAVLVIAVDYGGRWDIVQASKKIAQLVETSQLKSDEITPALFSQFLCSTDLPEPDLLIRTSGEQRISNFLLWQLAYTELFFTPTLWPDFDENTLDEALRFYATRERRYGRIMQTEETTAEETIDA